VTRHRPGQKYKRSGYMTYGKAGYIYLAKTYDRTRDITTVYKYGCTSRSPWQRMGQLNKRYKDKGHFNLVLAIWCDDCLKMEKIIKGGLFRFGVVWFSEFFTINEIDLTENELYKHITRWVLDELGE